MNLKITSQIELSNGFTTQNAVVILEFINNGGLNVVCELRTYKSIAKMDDGADAIYPVANGTLNKVLNCPIVLTQEQADGAGLRQVIHQLVADKLNTLYGWTVTVEI